MYGFRVWGLGSGVWDLEFRVYLVIAVMKGPSALPILFRGLSEVPYTIIHQDFRTMF